MKLYDIKSRGNQFSCIYMWENLVNGKKYVGQAQNFRKRMYAYQKGQFNLYIKSEIEEYGLENFEIHILEKDIPFEKLAQITSDNFHNLFRKASDKGRYDYK